MPLRLRLIKAEPTDFVYLDEEDICYYFGEYSSGQGYAYSETNDIILNFKKSPERKSNESEWQYKLKAIDTVARYLRENFINPLSYTFIPVPPSKSPTDPLYDDRLTQTLRRAFPGANIRELIVAKKTIDSHHEAADRNPQRLIENYSVNQNLVDPPPEKIIVFDDILASGSHFKAMKTIIRKTFPNAKIYGVFIARARNP